MALFIPTYFSPISQYSAIFKSNKITFEVEDNYQKQTYRNRCYIYGANGKQLLTVPVKFNSKAGRLKTKDILIENDFQWQKQHLKSLQAAYRSSPFFELLEDDISVIFTKKYKFLLDLNIDSYLFVNEILDIHKTFKKTTCYKHSTTQNDYRYLTNVKNKIGVNNKKYVQVFDNKYGFIENLSILDLFFMEGPNTVSFL